MSFAKIVVTVLVLVSCASSYAHAPKIFAHRGGKDNFPENTMHAFKSAVDVGSDGIEVDVQVSKDGVVVLYHPHDLAVWTNGKGPVNAWNYAELATLDAAYNFDPHGNKTFPERSEGHHVITLAAVIDAFPNLEIMVDFKAVPAKPLVDAAMKVVDSKDAWHRVIFYSTNTEHMDYLKAKRPAAKLFENRHTTRERLLTLRNGGVCCCSDGSRAYVGFELANKMVVKESFTLGEDANQIPFKLWDDSAVRCTRQAIGNKAKIFIFGINDVQSYAEARKLGAYAVMSDAPVDLIGQVG